MVEQPRELTGQVRGRTGPRARDQDRGTGGVLGTAQGLARGPEPTVRVGSPVLPGVDHLAGPVERPREVEGLQRGCGHGLEPHRRDHAEVAPASASQRPEQIRVVTGVHVTTAPLGGHHVHRPDGVAGESEGSGEHPDPTPEGEARDAHRGAGASRDRPSAAAARLIDRGQGRTGPHRGRAVGVESHPIEGATVDHQGARHAGVRCPARGPSGIAVPSRADGHRHVVFVGEGEGGADVGGGGDREHRQRAVVVIARVLDESCRVVPPVAGAAQVSLHMTSQLVPVASGRGGAAGCRRG